MSHPSDFGEQPHNVMSLMMGLVKSEVGDVKLFDGASELVLEDSLPEDSLDEVSNKEELYGKTQECSSDELQHCDSNAGTNTEKEPCVYYGQDPCDWESITMLIACTLGLDMEFFTSLTKDHYPSV
jgi:hypothetical protein